MDRNELRELINNTDKLNSFAENYFFPNSNDKKTISSKKKEEIIRDICDEYGFDVPSTNEIEQLDQKNFGSIFGNIGKNFGPIAYGNNQFNRFQLESVTFDMFVSELKRTFQVIEKKI